jgi:hypothetical protein
LVFQVQVVSISSLKGGVGKTSVTTGLASAALAAGIPTLVVDLDPHADASTALGVHPDAQRCAGVRMRIKIHHKGGDAGGQGRRCQSGGDGSFADPAFEAADADYLHLKNQYLTPVAVLG